MLSACPSVGYAQPVKLGSLLVVVGAVAALFVPAHPHASVALYPNAAVCARAWNHYASNGEKAVVVASHARDARVFATSNTGVPRCQVYFLAPGSVLYTSARFGAHSPSWTKPRVCRSQPAGVLMQVSRNGSINSFG